MPVVEFCALVESDAERVWTVLRQFGRIHAWHPGIVESHLEDPQPEGLPGSVRHLRLGDGAVVRERLLAVDDQARRLSYRFEEAPLPLFDYVAAVQVLALSDQPRAVIHWRAGFGVPTAESADHYQGLVRELIVAGHHGLAAFLADH